MSSLDPGMRGYIIGYPSTLINVNLLNFNLFYRLSQGVNVISTKFVSHQYTPITDDLICPFYMLSYVTSSVFRDTLS